jgi:hypothetical protein
LASANWFQDNWWFLAWCAFLGSMLLRSVVLSFRRKRAIERFALELHLAFAGDLLPSGLLLSRTSFASKNNSISNSVWGDLRGIPLAFFDLSSRSGKAGRSQTIVAFRREGAAGVSEAPIDAVGSYVFEGAGDWVIGYIPKRIVSVEELEDWCLELHRLARDLLAEARGDAEARPRLFRWLT